jgi:hypothetical protein
LNIEAGHLFEQALREARTGNGARGVGKEIHAHQLITHCLGNAGPPIADVHRPDTAREAVQIFLAVGVPQPQAAPFDEYAGVGPFEGLVLGQVMPDMCTIGLDDRTQFRRRRYGVHVAARAVNP